MYTAEHTDSIALSALRGVMDPEIPTVSLVDLGVVQSIRTDESGAVFVELIPTFAGCPAMDWMVQESEKALTDAGLANVHVTLNRNKPWSSDLLTEVGKAGLKKHGLSPPPAAEQGFDQPAECPRCASLNTELRNPFGPTLCRAIHYCNDCRETFEQFKPL